MAFNVSLKDLLEAGVHFGHQTKRWDPRMAPYIYTSRNDIHVIDLQKSIKYLEEAYNFVSELVSDGKKVLFIGTKKQSQEAIVEEAQRCGMPYISNRWLGGTLTNFTTIRKSVRKLKKLLDQRDSGEFEKLPVKEVSILNKKIAKMQANLGGILELNKLPDAVFIVDTVKDEIAVAEAKALGIPIVAVVDTNSNPTPIDYLIPGNDDAIRAIKLITSVIANAANDGNKKLLESDGPEVIAEMDEQEAMVAALEKEEAIIDKEKVKL